MIDDVKALQGDFIRRHRLAASRTQKSLAKAAGMSERTLIRAENGKGLSAENMLAICAVLSLNVADVPRTSADDAIDTVQADDAKVGGLSFGRWIGRRVVERSTAFVARPLRFHVACSLGSAVAIAFGFNAWYGVQTYRNADVAFDMQSMLVARTVAGMTSQVETILGDARPADVARVVFETDAQGYADCTRVSWFARLTQTGHCPTSMVKVTAGNVLPGHVEMEFGPLSKTTFLAVAALLPRTSSTDVSVAVIPAGSVDSGPGMFWFDPRGAKLSSLPDFRDGDSFALRMTRDVVR